ncbi:hypothetical protein C8F04DRAFT_1288476 [Mycena alexandri]|uniref:Lipoprotein n=1 Tax=Mycena alexandri TaxID=1745969 RepID=A0AAD6SKP3_9AGAR|nr:hypothetical protein C8F04DRAFT_1288476 [Mycena alexandri]
MVSAVLQFMALAALSLSACLNTGDHYGAPFQPNGNRHGTAVVLGVDSAQARTTYGVHLADIIQGGEKTPLTATHSSKRSHTLLHQKTAFLGVNCQYNAGSAVCNFKEALNAGVTTTVPVAPFILDVLATATPNSAERTTTFVSVWIGLAMSLYHML